MILTLLLSLMTMAGLFLMLWSGVAFIQDKRFFSSAHPDIPETAAVVGRRMFGYNKVSHVIHTLVYLSGAALISFICTRF